MVFGHLCSKDKILLIVGIYISAYPNYLSSSYVKIFCIQIDVSNVKTCHWSLSCKIYIYTQTFQLKMGCLAVTGVWFSWAKVLELDV